MSEPFVASAEARKQILRRLTLGSVDDSDEFTAGRENGHRRPKGYADWNPQRSTRRLLGAVLEVLDEYADHLPLTVRQVFYRLVGSHGYEKTERAYHRLCDHLVRARRARIIPFEHLRDDGVSIMADRWFADPADFWDHIGRKIKSYERDKQGGQPLFVELWCEAAGMMPQLAYVAADYSVPVFSCGGFSSLTAVRHIVNRVLSRDCPTVLLHVGDCDPSGQSIFDAMVEDVNAFLRDDALLAIHHLFAKRVALTLDQVDDFDLPTAPPKASDTRSHSWLGETAQAEALPPDVLAELVREAIERCIDVELVDRHQAAERRERVDLARALPRGDGPEGGGHV